MIPGSGRPTGEGIGYPLQYSWASLVAQLVESTRRDGKGLHLAMTGEPRGFSRVTAGFSSYDGEIRLPLVLAQASPIFHSSCEGKLGIALE